MEFDEKSGLVKLYSPETPSEPFLKPQSALIRRI
jgi:hypothetical protein